MNEENNERRQKIAWTLRRGRLCEDASNFKTLKFNL